MRHIFFIGFLLLVVSFTYSSHKLSQIENTAFAIKPEKVSAAQKPISANEEPIHIGSGFITPVSLEKPQKIIIPAISIDLEITEAAIIDGHWEVSETFANHGIGSAYPGQKGNMVIFAHAREHLFLNLQNSSIGNQITIVADKKKYTYTVTEIIQVTPDQLEVIAPTDDEWITLFTCSGFADEKRLIVIGKRNIPPTFGLDETFMNLLE